MGFCLFIVHTGVKKCLSNAAILQNYQIALDGMSIYHDFIMNSQAPEIDKTLAPLVSILEKGILNGYKTSEDSMYLKIKSSLFYCLMHDGITKFGKEYNGTCLRGVDCETYKPFNLPYCLTNVLGAMTLYLLEDVLIKTIATFSNVENSAYSVVNNEIQRLIPERNNYFQKNLPHYLKLGTLERLDIENK